MRVLLCFALTLVFSPIIAQVYVSELVEVADALEYDDMRPRIELINGTPNVYWMQSNGRLWLNQKTSDSTFSTPDNLNSADHNLFVSNYGGSDIAVNGSSVYLTYMTKPFLEAKVYLKKSTDGGSNWSDPQLISLPDSVIPFLPTVAIDEFGDPMLMIMAYDQDYNHPEWVTLKSTNGGTSFQSMLSVSEMAPSEVCDCCPANLNVVTDQVVATFRNNDNNIRDTWIATSHDGGNQYDTVQDVDPGNWSISGCPSSGPDAYVDGNAVHSTWMSAGNGSARIYYSKMSTTTYDFETGIAYESGSSQNFPRITGNGDTLGLVFQNTESGLYNCLFIYSTDGGRSWSQPIDIYGDSISIQGSPDITFENGVFHIVFTDLFTKTILYRSVSFGSPSGITTISEQKFRVFPNPARDILNLDPIPSSKTPFTTRNALGKIMTQGFYNGPLNLDGFSPGLYFIEIDGVSQKFVVK